MRKFPILIFFATLPCCLIAQNTSCGTPDAVFARYRTALGGDSALDQLQSLLIEASATEPHTFNPNSTAHYQYRLEWKAPDKIRVHQRYMLSTATVIFDGTAWSNHDGKLSHNEDNTPAWRKRLMASPYNDYPQFQMFRVAANPLLLATTKNLYPRYKTAPAQPGLCVIEADGRSEWGRQRRDYLSFDAASGLLKTWAIQAGMPGEETWLHFQFDDYQPAGPVKIPLSIYFDFYNTSFRITRAVPNAPLPDADFVPMPNP